jgi:hypothetical protein
MSQKIETTRVKMKKTGEMKGDKKSNKKGKR